MPLNSVAVNSAFNWQLNRTNTGFADAVQGPDVAAFSLNSLSVATWTELFGAQYTIAAAGTQVIDLRSFTDLDATSVTGTKALAIQIYTTGAVGDLLNVKGNATNALQWFFDDATKGINIPGGGCFMFSEGASSTGTTVDGTHKQLLLTNNGAASLTVTVVAIVSTL